MHVPALFRGLPAHGSVQERGRRDIYDVQSIVRKESFVRIVRYRDLVSPGKGFSPIPVEIA